MFFFHEFWVSPVLQNVLKLWQWSLSVFFFVKYNCLHRCACLKFSKSLKCIDSSLSALLYLFFPIIGFFFEWHGVWSSASILFMNSNWLVKNFDRSQFSKTELFSNRTRLNQWSFRLRLLHSIVVWLHVLSGLFLASFRKRLVGDTEM